MYRAGQRCLELFSFHQQPSASPTEVFPSWTRLPVEVVMISQESTTKDVKLVGYNFRGHTEGSPCSRDSLWLSLLYGSSNFSLVFSTTSEKSFIPHKASATVQALKICPVWPRVLSSWGITLLEKLRAADES